MQRIAIQLCPYEKFTCRFQCEKHGNGTFSHVKSPFHIWNLNQ